MADVDEIIARAIRLATRDDGTTTVLQAVKERAPVRRHDRRDARPERSRAQPGQPVVEGIPLVALHSGARVKGAPAA